MPSSSLFTQDHITGHGTAAQNAIQMQGTIRHSAALTAMSIATRLMLTINIMKLEDINITAWLAMNATLQDQEKEDSITAHRPSR